MKRRTFLGTALAWAAGSPLFAAPRRQRWDGAAEVLEQATAKKQVDAAVLHVVHRGEAFTRHFGKAASGDAMFLLGSISKPINVAAIMTLFDQGKFRLDDRVKKFLPAFQGGGRLLGPDQRGHGRGDGGVALDPHLVVQEERDGGGQPRRREGRVDADGRPV